MHGLINRAIERFVRDTYGRDTWGQLVARADIDFTEFESMLTYEDELTEQVLEAAGTVLGKPREEVLEDIGTYLVSHPKVEALRRLLRFGGADFTEFLHSLDDLPGRARLAVANLDMPDLELREHGSLSFSLICRSPKVGFGYVLIGLLRAMADDYGALVMLDHKGSKEGTEIIEVRLLAMEHTSGRRFELSAGAA